MGYMLGGSKMDSSISRRNPFLKLEASSSVQARIQEGTSYEEQNLAKTYAGRDFFEEMKQRFLNFKKHKYL